MSVRKLKPITSAQRFRVVNGFDAITTDKPEKSLLAPKKRTGGRNSQGKMTMSHRGGGHKKKYRIIDFKRNKTGIPAEVKSIEYDPNRTAFIALLNYQDGEKRYIIAQNGLQVGQNVVSGSEGIAPEIGNAMPLSQIPLGTIISCIELRPGQGAHYYIAQMNSLKSWNVKDETVLKAQLDKAQEQLNLAMAISEGNPELMVLQAQILTNWVAFDGMTYGMKYSAKITELYNKAAAIAPENPRVVFCKADWAMGSARYFGQDTKPFCSDVEKSIELFANFKPESPMHPTWGKKRAKEVLAGCKE